MIRAIGLITALAVFLGSPAVALSCAAPSAETSCCCTPATENATGRCPMIEAAPSPMAAVLMESFSVEPDLVAIEWLPSGDQLTAEAHPHVVSNQAQAPPDRLSFRSPPSLRAPPALLA